MENISHQVWDNTIKIWNVDKGKLIVTMFATRNGEYVVFTPDGYYDSSPAGHNFIAWRAGEQVFTSNEYKKNYYKPDIIKQRLSHISKK